MSRDYDVIVLGQGLAGTALGWCLRFAGVRFLVIDREEPVTSSKVAAGLITPVTGQKLVRTWRHADAWPAAVEFYQQVERESATSFFRTGPMVRLLQTNEEVHLFKRRLEDPEFAELTRKPIPNLDPSSFAQASGAFEMIGGGQLNVLRYLEASRQEFLRTDSYQAADLDVSRDTDLKEGAVAIPGLGITAKVLVLCQGFHAAENPWFQDVRFKPAKGEILTIRVPGLEEQRVVHRGIWLAPIGGGLFKAGATYDWNRLDTVPTATGRDEILAGLRQLLRLPFEVVEHAAAIRPIHRNQYPILGRHPLHPQVAFFNGLGSKGSLHAPYFARHLVRHLLDGEPLDPAVDLNRKTRWANRSWGANRSHQAAVQSVGGTTGDSSAAVNLDLERLPKSPRSRPLTQQAQHAVRVILRPGDAAIDATAGNGHDTVWLADHVGSTGNVWAFDVQQMALDNTASRLAAAGLTNVELVLRNHRDMAAVIQPEWHRRIAAIMFNLGYLPGGDKSRMTSIESTLQAIVAAGDLLRPGGILTILAYTGHDGGQAEARAAEELIDGFPAHRFAVRKIESTPGKLAGPRLFLVERCE